MGMFHCPDQEDNIHYLNETSVEAFVGIPLEHNLHHQHLHANHPPFQKQCLSHAIVSETLSIIQYDHHEIFKLYI